jgi:hypothetical protein
MVIALTACGSTPVTYADIPLPTDITALAPGQNTLADTLNSSFSDALRSHGSVETKLYSVPATMTSEQVSAFYAEQLGKTDWKPSQELTQDSGAFKTVGWQRGGYASEQGLVVGYSADMLGDGAFMMVALFSE